MQKLGEQVVEQSRFGNGDWPVRLCSANEKTDSVLGTCRESASDVHPHLPESTGSWYGVKRHYGFRHYGITDRRGDQYPFCLRHGCCKVGIGLVIARSGATKQSPRLFKAVWRLLRRLWRLAMTMLKTACQDTLQQPYCQRCHRPAYSPHTQVHSPTFSNWSVSIPQCPKSPWARSLTPTRPVPTGSRTPI
jgi:hypothetical protein